MQFKFKHHIIDTSLPGRLYAQTALVDLDGDGTRWIEHDSGHEAVIGDITGNGLPDIVSKPWSPRPDNALHGNMFVVFLENRSV